MINKLHQFEMINAMPDENIILHLNSTSYLLQLPCSTKINNTTTFIHVSTLKVTCQAYRNLLYMKETLSYL